MPAMISTSDSENLRSSLVIKLRLACDAYRASDASVLVLRTMTICTFSGVASTSSWRNGKTPSSVPRPKSITKFTSPGYWVTIFTIELIEFALPTFSAEFCTCFTSGINF